MTVCLAALCADEGSGAQAVVIACDRMVTWRGLTEFEHGMPKIENVSDRVVGLFAGDSLRGANLIQHLQLAMSDQSPSAEKVATVAGKVYETLREEQVQATIFSPRGVTMEEFYRGLQNQWIQSLAANIDEQVRTYDYGVELLLAGADRIGAHLYMINNPGGGYDDYRKIGFAATGSGSIHAIQSMIGMGHDPTCPLPEAIYRVYVSKCRAEVAPGVGRETDLTVIMTKRPYRVDLGEDVLQALEDIRAERQGPPADEVGTRVARLLEGPDARGTDSDEP